MKNQIVKSLFIIFTGSLLFISCKKNNDNDSKNERKVKYELSGSFTGKLLVVTSTNSGALQQFNAVAVPWVKEISYDKNVMAAGASLQTENENKGVPGQTLTLKIFLNGKLKDTRQAAADANGVVNMALSFYTF